MNYGKLLKPTHTELPYNAKYVDLRCTGQLLWGCYTGIVAIENSVLVTLLNACQTPRG